MKWLLLLISIFCISCTAEKSGFRQSRYKMTVDQLKALKGEPNQNSVNLIDSKYEMLHYGNDTYQVDGEKVIAHFRDPLDHEKDIQYWRHSLKNIFYSIHNDPNSKEAHDQLKILSCAKKGLTIYFNSSGKVLRVGESLGVTNE